MWICFAVVEMGADELCCSVTFSDDWFAVLDGVTSFCYACLICLLSRLLVQIVMYLTNY